MNKQQNSTKSVHNISEIDLDNKINELSTWLARNILSDDEEDNPIMISEPNSDHNRLSTESTVLDNLDMHIKFINNLDLLTELEIEKFHRNLLIELPPLRDLEIDYMHHDTLSDVQSISDLEIDDMHYDSLSDVQSISDLDQSDNYNKYETNFGHFTTKSVSNWRVESLCSFLSAHPNDCIATRIILDEFYKRHVSLHSYSTVRGRLNSSSCTRPLYVPYACVMPSLMYTPKEELDELATSSHIDLCDKLENTDLKCGQIIVILNEILRRHIRTHGPDYHNF